MITRQQFALLLGLTVVMAGLVALLVFVVLRFAAAARDLRRGRNAGGDRAILSAALEEAVGRLKAQERATAARAEASERLGEEIVVGLTAGLLVVGLQGEVRILNPAGRRLLAATAEPLPADYRAISPHAAPLVPVIEECFRTRRAIVRRALQMPAPRHVATHLGVTVSPLVDADGQLQGAICLFTDLSSIVELEEQLRLKDTLAKLGELTAGIAHEFRNGLATIHGYSRLLDPKVLPEAYRAYVEGVRHEAESLGQIVTNFLNFAKPAQLTLAPVDLRAVADRAADEVRAEARARGGEVRIAGEFATVEGDEVLLRQAFSNLLRNALEACVPTGVPPQVEITGEIDHLQGICRLTVADNGPGIDPALRDRIFRPFFTTKARGTGLGLALVQKIVVTHNGRIVVGAGAGGGARMQLVFPLSAPGA